MRDYSKVSGQFWTGKTGRMLRGDMQAQVVALYLMTSPHSTMIGVYHCPILYIAHETGSPLEGASEALQRLFEGGFCTYDRDSETVWVHEMARFQVGEALKASDNRVKDVQRQYESMPEGPIRRGFFQKYSLAFHLKPDKPLASPLQAPPKPGEGTGAGTGAGENLVAAAKRGSRLPSDWLLPKSWGDWAMTEKPGWSEDDVRAVAASFADFWQSKAGRDACKVDWEKTWRVWVRKEPNKPRGSAAGTQPPIPRNLIMDAA